LHGFTGIGEWVLWHQNRPAYEVTLVNCEIWDSPQGAEVYILSDWNLRVMRQTFGTSGKIPNPVDLEAGEQSVAQFGEV
jgi:hypothetical protein